MKKLTFILLWIWQLPQHLIALVIIAVTGAKKHKSWYSCKKFMDSGVSLGNYIILQGDQFSFETLDHERGHSKQSQMLGPFYLLVVGIASATLNIISRIKKHDAAWYYTKWPENWADKLGGVYRF